MSGGKPPLGAFANRAVAHGQLQAAGRSTNVGLAERIQRGMAEVTGPSDLAQQ
jgi:hypothetical protein